MLALDLNGKAVDPDHGAPVRLRIPTQLAYKSTKWVQRIELVADFKHIFGGNGGYWEDQGYQWYAGI
jgi:DMSO/TMAO reductase YedYZ molybdopterin-dependent catalytic subunit